MENLQTCTPKYHVLTAVIAITYIESSSVLSIRELASSCRFCPFYGDSHFYAIETLFFVIFIYGWVFISKFISKLYLCIVIYCSIYIHDFIVTGFLFWCFWRCFYCINCIRTKWIMINGKWYFSSFLNPIIAVLETWYVQTGPKHSLLSNLLHWCGIALNLAKFWIQF